ncbi:PREDICTED: protein sprint isoform X2 [Rhagoletis zephyria]|uniref:protein sprint isoform X2 n=1 Tax=Rhagoletis zephyria TaxID=28612 RepID=UPI0008118175|nr:PREDICTED: protein sprint isoform X2 [Rhagoletis zephyria]
MNWFKKLSAESLANPHSRKQCEQRHKRIKKTAERESGNFWGSLDGKEIEIVDPEVFFQDPDHVRNYKEEAQFLQLMSDWEIIPNPANMENYFSADFEDELVLHKTQNNAVDEQTVIAGPIEPNKVMGNENKDPAETTTKKKLKRRFCDIFFNEKIQMGLLLPEDEERAADAPQHIKCKRRAMEGDSSKMNSQSTIASSISSLQLALTGSLDDTSTTKAMVSASNNQVIKDCAINRNQLKTEALASSIMGAIGMCPDRDSSQRSSDCDLIARTDDRCPHSSWSSCDHYDIKQFFRLDDYGNILLNTNHIAEMKGFGSTMAQNRRLYRRYRKMCQAVDERYVVRAKRRGCLETLKRVLLWLWHLMCGHPRNKLNAHTGGPGDLVRACTLQLAQDQSSTFARNVENFISCTKESREAAPQVVMRNMRQFMNGMKNYLVKHGEGKFHQEVEAARSRLKADEFLNLDAILETVMHQLVVLPLREHLYSMFVDYYKRSEDIQLLAQNVKYACGRSATDFGIRATVTPPSSTSLQIISALLQRLQEAELPLDKLELFLCVISTIFEATGCQRGQQLGADDFLPVLVYVVAKCGFVGAEIEAEFMWGLLQPTLLSGEAGYYLTALCSAVHVLKSFMASENENGTGSLDWRSSSLPACSSVLRVIIPDECNGSLQTRTLPVRPHTTTREVCRIIAHKARITNPQDYALFKLVDGEETLLNDVECPQDVRFSSKGKHCMLAYKRIDAKIAWPTATY